MAPPETSSTRRILLGSLAGFVVGVVLALLVNAVDGGAVNPFLFGAFGTALGAGIAGDRRGDAG